MSKIISAGILLESQSRFLIGHPTELTGTTNGWGILKGKVDDGESLIDAAIREFGEESNVDLEPYLLDDRIMISPRPFFRYNVNGDKTVYVFWAYDLSGLAINFNFSCPSFVEGTDKPEIDKYQWVTVDEAINLVTASQKKLFKYVKDLTQRD